MSEWLQQAERTLAANGCKRGGARQAVLELLDGQPCALSAQEVEQALRLASTRGASRASVYRVLEELDRLGLVQRVETRRGTVSFERACRAEEHHHHLVCDGCGAVTPFSDRRLEQAIARISERVPLAVAEHEIVLRGSCPDCVAGPPTGS